MRVRLLLPAAIILFLAVAIVHVEAGVIVAWFVGLAGEDSRLVFFIKCFSAIRWLIPL